MRPKRITVAAGAVGNWIPVNRKSYGDIGFTVKPQSGAGGTYDVEFTESDIQRGQDVRLSRSTTVLTVTLVNHGLTTSTTDTQVRIVGSRNADYDALYTLASVVDADNFTVTVAASGDAPKAKAIPIVADDLTGFTAATGTNSGNIFASITAVRLNCANSTSAAHDLILNQVD